MNPREEHDLERFIDERLRKLPEQTAPDTLLVNVLGRVHALENKAWWQEPYTEWPRRIQALLFFTLAAVFSGTLALLWRPAEQVTSNTLVQHLRSFTWVGDLYEALEMSLKLLVKNMSWPWIAAVAALFVLMYCASLAGAFALYRVAAHPPRGR